MSKINSLCLSIKRTGQGNGHIGYRPRKYRSINYDCPINILRKKK